MKEKIKNIKEYVINKIRNNQVVVLVILLLGIGFIYNNYSEKRTIAKSGVTKYDPSSNKDSIFIDTSLYNKTVKEKREYLLKNFNNDFVIGDEKAMATIIDFSSFSCKFCQEMRDGMNRIIKEYATEKKQLRYVFRPVVNKKTIALKILLNCISDKDKQWKIINYVFAVNWEKIPSMKIATETLTKKYEIDINKISSCLNDDLERNRIIYYHRENDLVFNLQRTPFFVINGRTYRGFKTYEELKSIVEGYVGKN
jgi:hypothetical protein